MISAVELNLRVRECLAWSSACDVANYDFRNDDLLPTGWSRERVVEDTDANVCAIADDIALSRRAQLQRRGIMLEEGFAPAGRALVSVLSVCGFDGLGMDVSNGFIDIRNLPGWDTWLCGIELASRRPDWWAIVAWIPVQLIEVCQAAIDCNCEAGLYWSDDEWASECRELDTVLGQLRAGLASGHPRTKGG